MEKPQGLLNQPNPKTQEQVDIFVSNGIQIIHSKKISDNIIKQLKGSKDPVEVISTITLKVVEILENDAVKKGVTLTDVTKVHGANQLMGEIINLAEKAKAVEPLNDEQKYQAFALAVSTYLDRAVKSGKITQEQLMALAKEAQQTPEGQKIAQELQRGQESQPVTPNVSVPPGTQEQQNNQMMRR
jgi:hypothetical protein